MTKYWIIKNSEYTDPYFIQKQRRFLWWNWWVYVKEFDDDRDWFSKIHFLTYQEAKKKIQALYQEELDRMEGLDKKKIEVIEEFNSLPL